MANDTVHHNCSEKIYRGGSGYRYGCAKSARVERIVKRTVYPPAMKLYDEATFQFTDVSNPSYQVEEPRWFCGTHDPVAIEQRDQKRRTAQAAEWKAKVAREDAYRNTVELITKRRQAVIDAAVALVKAEKYNHVRFPELVALDAAVAALEAK
jgi:hypothetical protein